MKTKFAVLEIVVDVFSEKKENVDKSHTHMAEAICFSQQKFRNL